MSKLYTGLTTNGVTELTLQEEGVGNIGTQTIVWDGATNGVIDQVQGDIPFNYASTEGITSTAKGLVIGTSCTSIGSYAFLNCTNITGSLVIPDSVTTIEDSAFYFCTGLTGSLVIPNSVTTIGVYAFGFCSGLTGSLVIPNSVTTIGGYAFSYCSGLNSVVISDSVTTIGSFAFGSCSNLTTAYLATPFANIPTGGFGSGAFYFSGLTTVYAKDAVANGWTLGAGQTVGGKTGVTVIDWTNYPNIP